jgi:hypothetical protein
VSFMLSMGCWDSSRSSLESVFEVNVVPYSTVLSGHCHSGCSLSRPVKGGSSDSHTLLKTINSGFVHAQGSSDTLGSHVRVQKPNCTIFFAIDKA